MGIAMRRVPLRAIRRWLAGLLFALLAWCPHAHALDAALDIDQYAHTAWHIGDGVANGYVTSFAQGADGYLWLGTDFGVLRFDGVRTVPLHTDVPLTDERIRCLLMA